MATMLSAPIMTSCYDDSGLWESISKLENSLNELKAQLDSQAEAMSALLSNGSTIKSCVKQKDGSYVVTLSNDIKFKVLASTVNASALMSYVVESGEKYWAVYSATGELTPVTDIEGNKIPVSAQVNVELRDGKYILVINGYEYETGYDSEDVVQVFESCEPHADASGNVYAMTFSFGEGVEVTISVDGYKGVLYKLENAGAAALVSDYYIPYGTTQTFLLDKEGVIEYAALPPTGWKVVERVDKQTGNTYVDITSPSKTLVESGAAFADGELKTVAIVEGGDATITKLTLSAEPFKTLDMSSTRLSAEPYTGLSKFVYGIVALENYEESAILAEIETILTTTGDLPAGYAVSESGVNVSMTEILGGDLDVEKRYVLFIMPVLYDLELESVYYIDPSMLVTYDFGAILTTMGEPVPGLMDAEISVEVLGTDKMWAGTALKSEGLFADIIYSVVNGIMEPYTEGLVYNGLASQYPVADANLDVNFTPGTTYVTWCIPYDPDKTTYTEDDIVYKEFTTNALTSGGSLELTLGDVAVTNSSITIPIASEGAEMIYYAFLSDDEGRRLGPEEGMDVNKFGLITKSANCAIVKGSEAVASIEGILPESTMWLYAVAVGADGKYGTVKCQSATLDKVTFNTAMTVSYTNWDIRSDKIEYTISVANGTPSGYIYWIGTTMDPLWVKCGKDRNTLAKYMAVYPEDEAITKVMRAHGEISEDGKITITGLRMEEDYVMMVLAKDDQGLYTKGAYKLLKTLAADLGDVVTTGSEKWEAAKNSIKIDWIQNGFMAAASQAMMARYAFNFSCPQDYTAFVLCASDTYFEDAGLTKMSQIMIEIQNYCSRKYDDGRTPIMANGEYASEPDYYKDGEFREGQMMNVVDFYVHGLPTMGFATYFAPNSHGEGNCIYWDNGHDVNYQRALDMIESYKALEKYEARAAAFGLKGKEAADWAKALLEAYLPYYQEAKPLIYINNGEPLYMMNPYAMGVNDKGELPDRVVVMLKDLQGNYFEPMYFEVPNYFENKE